MGFKNKISPEQRAKSAAEKIIRIEMDILDKLHIIGERFIADARSELSQYKYIEVSFKKSGENRSKITDTRIYYRNGKKYTRQDIGGSSFSDWTSNLRSSIGYFIFQDAQLIENNIGDGEGGATATTLAYKVAAPQGISIVFTAGMGYAKAVEAKGYSVITAAAMSALKNLKQQLLNIEKKSKRMK